MSELSWTRIKQPSDVLNIGDEIEVYVISFDRDKRKISLGYKDPEANPWKIFTEKYKVGDVASVKVVKLMDCETVCALLAEKGIAVRGGLHCAPLAHGTAGTLDTGTVRLSFSPFTKLREVEKACGVLRKIVN